jgi:hypothetical protein
MPWRSHHSIKEYVRGDAHTNTVEVYFSIEAHLHRYLAEFDFRYNHRARLGVDDLSRADVALRGAVGKRLTYRSTRSWGERIAQ